LRGASRRPAGGGRSGYDDTQVVRGIPIQRTETGGSKLSEARWPSLLAVAGLAAVVLVYLARCGAFWDYVNDDAFITFRYSRFLAIGRGPYFNVGEHVEGYTNFLLMLLMAPVFRLGGEAAVPLAAKAVGVASGIGSLLVAWALVRTLLAANATLHRQASAVGVGAAALLAASPAFAVNSTSGLATTLFGFLLVLGVMLSIRGEQRGSWCGAGIAFAGLVLARPEGIFLFAIAWVGTALAVAWARRRPSGTGEVRTLRPSEAYRRLLVDAAVVASVFAAHLLFRILAYDGEWLPNTYYAKAGGFWKVDAWRYVYDGIVAPFFGPLGVSLAALGAAAAVRRTKHALVVFATAVGGACVPFITGSDWMPGWRLLVPYLPIAACAVAIGWASALAWALPRARTAAPIAVLVGALVLGWTQLPLQAKMQEVIGLRARGYETGHRALAEWLRDEAAEPGDRVALMDIGIVGYLCVEQSILDLSGLTDRFIAKSEGSFLRKRYDPKYVLEKKPRFVVLTLTADGWYYQPPPPGTQFHFWTRVERRLYRDEEFQARYPVRAEAPPDGDGDWRDALARRWGAVRVFEHAYPGAYYLLAVYDAEAGARTRRASP
jgi:arabinofuranosyltransferase